MIKLNIFLLFASLIVADQLEEIIYINVMSNKWLSDNPPRNYKEHYKNIENIKKIKTRMETLESYVISHTLDIKKKIKELSLPESKATELEKISTETLMDVKSYFESRIPPSLYPYINNLLIDNIIHTIDDMYLVIYRCLDYFKTISDRDPDAHLKKKINEIGIKIDNEEYRLQKILFYSFMTLSKNASEHRKIHIKSENNLEDISSEVKCQLCNKIIQQDHYVFSLLCGHQIHIVCMKKYFTDIGMENNCPICKENIWIKIEIEGGENQNAIASGSSSS